MRVLPVLLLLLGCAMAPRDGGAVDIVSFSVVNYNPRVSRITLRCVGAGGGMNVIFRNPAIGQMMRSRDTIFCSRYALDILFAGERTPWTYPLYLEVMPGDTVCVEVFASRSIHTVFVTCSQRADA